ncbi:hypothetical protein KY360_01230 [Candidatus Woesearchaeota archaeon]|nr:hypothetical protein [Candidatus Woesearchaeota archaeon]
MRLILSFSIIGILILSSCASLSGDPFGKAPPETYPPNCGPENRYKFDATISSKEDFINFIKTHEINEWVRLDDYKDESKEVQWDKVLAAIKTENIGGRTVYILNYNPIFEGEGYYQMCSGFTLKMTNDGHVSVYGCCGK